MKKYIFFLVGLCCALLPAMADQPELLELKASDANIIGHVLDKKTGEHLSYITIALKGTTIGTVTDATGHYFLKNLPEGNFVLEASSVGYKTISRNVSLRKGKTLEENFELEEDAVALDGVVVSANRSVTKRRLAPTLVNVVDMKMFENTNSPTLSQGLNFQPGVRVETNCQNCGFQQVRINGLDGPYTQILIDSRPIFSALSGVYGLEQIPANMIERVEVMRGGGSALFGSSAIAGTINIITKEPLRNSGQLAHTLTSIGGSSSFDNNTSLNASLVTDNHRAGLYVFGQNRHRDAYDHDGDGYSEMPKLKNQTVGFRSFLKTSTYSKLTFEYHHLQEFRRGGNLLNRPPHEADIAEQIQHSINGGGLKFDYFAPNEKHRLTVYTSAQHTDRDSYYGSKKDQNAYGKTTDLTFIGGSQYVYSFGKCLFMPADLTAGLEYNRDNLKDDMWGYNRYTKQTVNIGSAFLQNEWKNEKWSILLGGRLDKHNLIDHVIFSPRANLRFNPSEDINLRLSYSSGFRAPQAFDEDLHIENVGGTVSMIERAKNLKEEKSQSFSASADMYHRFGAVLRNRQYVRYILQYGFTMGVLFTNIASAPFIMQQHYGLSPMLFSVCFGVNAVAMVISSALSVRCSTMEHALHIGNHGMLFISVLLSVAFFLNCNFWVYEVLVFCLLSMVGMAFTASNTLAMDCERRNAGVASALLGAIGFAFGGIVSPLVGMGDIRSSAGFLFFMGALCSCICARFSFHRLPSRRKGLSYASYKIMNVFLKKLL